ncbi:Brp/Blh family beta-carotene 15,15'-monooxygenase [Microcella putealis]|uniref:Probable beta-carotene 15,15'-dioxygenase n=1 Tax=Microcella putealis TaxID=337005 RepID=A0A4Q7LPX9_9MICO|nr:Brp/Blh family beta-carotene 15,15'-dioxygenase [Microcella putealis]RZS56262.1 Brp/Blh family beta-carotene 15,15'-monooxygenase [Microcella putealis]TQM27251.1 Brp/Blh family beta-carotene 15,15'-monooxygenase [Microcella putealis]
MRPRVETVLFGAMALIAVFAYLLADPGVPIVVQITVITVLVAVLGLPHGALDPVVARRLGLWRGTRSLALFTLGYVAISAAVIGLWLIAPVASLVAFLLISAAHFGGDWNTSGPISLRLLVGVGLLSLPSLADEAAVAELYVTLSGPDAALIAMVQNAIGPLLLVGMIVAGAIAARRRPADGLEIVVVVALALTTPPLVFFIIYFCLLHSARHLREGFVEERGVLPRRAVVTIVAGATIVPIIAAVVFLASTGGGGSLDDRLIQVVFIGLAALTVPHMIVVTLGDRARIRNARTALTHSGDDPQMRTAARAPMLGG